MTRKKPSTDLLIDDASRFARALLKRASETKVVPQADGGELTTATPAYDLETQAAVLGVITRWTAVQYRIRPPEEESSDFDKLRGRLGGGGAAGATAGGRASGKAASAQNGSRPGIGSVGDAYTRRTASDED